MYAISDSRCNVTRSTVSAYELLAFNESSDQLFVKCISETIKVAATTFRDHHVQRQYSVTFPFLFSIHFLYLVYKNCLNAY